MLPLPLTIASPSTKPPSWTLPANSVAPVIVSDHTLASPAAGDVLSLSAAGTWSGKPAPAKTYQWRYSGTDTAISGATATSYTVTSADVGKAIYLAETATSFVGAVTTNSNASGTVA